jgi:hypothetical protein
VSGASAAGFSPHAPPDPQGRLTTDSTQNDTNERDALRLLATATEVARRLRSVCADWPPEQFGGLVYEAALARLGGELSPEGVARLRREYESRRDMYLTRLQELAG